MPEAAPIELETIKQSIAGLTKRQRAILAWIALGKSNAEIAEIIRYSGKLIEAECSRIFGKLGVGNRTTAAVSYALWQSGKASSSSILTA